MAISGPARRAISQPERQQALVRDADLILTPSHLRVVLAFSRRRAWLGANHEKDHKDVGTSTP